MLSLKKLQLMKINADEAADTDSEDKCVIPSIRELSGGEARYLELLKPLPRKRQRAQFEKMLPKLYFAENLTMMVYNRDREKVASIFRWYEKCIWAMKAA